MAGTLLQTGSEELARRSGQASARSHPIWRFVGRRTAQGILTLLAASIVIFIAMTALPGSPASSVLGKNATPAAVAAINHRLGYDRAIYVQYVNWLGGMLHGSFGNSAIAVAQGKSQTALWPIIRSPLENTASLALVTVVLLVPLSLILGAVAGFRRGRASDHIIATSTLVLMALPEFVVGAILIVIFFTVLNLLPPVSLLSPGAVALAHPKILVLPVLTLLAVSVAWTVRLVRAGTIEVLEADYVRMARLAGLPERRVLSRYVLRNALAPSVQIFALSIQYLFGGVIVTETVFNYPGLGSQLLNAVMSHDNTQVQAIAMILATIYIVINVVADLTVVLLVPRLRAQA